MIHSSIQVANTVLDKLDQMIFATHLTEDDADIQ